MRQLAADGFRPLLVDWGKPGPDERGFDLTAYIAGRLGAALDQVHALTGRAPVVIGYCMGGQLALALAQLPAAPARRPRAARDAVGFPCREAARRRGRSRRRRHRWLPLLDHLGGMPVDMLQGLFAALDPFLVVRKFCAFARLDPASDRAPRVRRARRLAQ